MLFEQESLHKRIIRLVEHELVEARNSGLAGDFRNVFLMPVNFKNLLDLSDKQTVHYALVHERLIHFK